MSSTCILRCPAPTGKLPLRRIELEVTSKSISPLHLKIARNVLNKGEKKERAEKNSQQKSPWKKQQGSGRKEGGRVEESPTLSH